MPLRYRHAVTVETLRPRQDWRIPVAAFWITQLVEGMGVSQVFALLPAYLRQLGVPEADRIAFVGLYSSLIFVVGLPLVPLWGVWADKYSRKAVIVRSALVEAVVFALAALAREPWQMAIAVMLIGFQLGNTGVMLAAIRDVTPKARLGTTIGLFGAAGPIGFALGPALAGLLIDGAGWGISGVYALSALFSVGTALLVSVGTHEIRPEVIPQGSVIGLAFGAMRSVLADPVVRRLFLVYGVVFLANQVSRPYIPVLVESIVGTGAGLAAGIGIVMGFGSLVGALVAPGSGWVGINRVPAGARDGVGRRGHREPVDAADARDRLARAHLDPAGSGRGDDGGDGVLPPRDGGPRGAPVHDAQPRLPAAVHRGDHRPRHRRGARRGRGPVGAVRSGGHRVPARGDGDRRAPAIRGRSGRPERAGRAPDPIRTRIPGRPAELASAHADRGPSRCRTC